MRKVSAIAVVAVLLAAVCMISADATAQGAARERIDFLRGKSVVIDGVISDGEWDDARSLKIAIEAGWEAEVRYKHDGANLLFAFLRMKAEDGKRIRTAEVLVDTLNDGGETWGADDFWFHASAQDCVNKGRHEDYNTCRPVVPEMEASNGTRGTLPMVYEIRIPYETVGLKAGVKKELGMAIDVTDTQKNWEFWPAKAQMRVPATWGLAISSDNWGGK